MIELSHPPYTTCDSNGMTHHYNIFIPMVEDTEYFGICQQIDAQIMGWA